VKNPEPIRKSQVEIKIRNLDTDRVTVEKILLTSAAKFALFDNTHTSRVPNTIRSIVEGDGFGFGLGACIVEGSVFVDFNRPKTDSAKFDAVREFILNELRAVFQSELPEVWENNPAYCKTC
jgi:hypothetical protein